VLNRVELGVLDVLVSGEVGVLDGSELGVQTESD
jgi:hypothetical protein